MSDDVNDHPCYHLGDRVRLVKQVPDSMVGKYGTVGLVYADGDLEVTLDGDFYPTICGPEQLERVPGGVDPAVAMRLAIRAANALRAELERAKFGALTVSPHAHPNGGLVTVYLADFQATRLAELVRLAREAEPS